MDGGLLEWGFSVILVGIYALQRFSTPPRHRFSTTKWRFLRSAFFYVFAVEILFFLLVAVLSISTPDGSAILNFFGMASPSQEQAQLSKQLLAALALTTLLPSLDKLAAIDERLRKFSWRVGHIPGMADTLASRLRDARHEMPKEFIKEVERELGPSFPASAIRPRDDKSLEHLWTTVTTLSVIVRDWARQNLSKSSWSDEDRSRWESLRQVRQHLSEDYKTLFDAYDPLKERAAACFTATTNAAINDVAAQEYRKDLRERIVRYYEDLSLYCAYGVLLAGSAENRRRLLAKMGFAGVRSTIRTRTPIHILAALYLLLLTIMTIIIALLRLSMGPSVTDKVDGFDPNRMMAIMPMVATIYFCGILLALYPKSAWQEGPTVMGSVLGRPVGSYLLSGALAVVASMIISFIFRSIMEASFETAFIAFYWTYPWFIATFVFTVLLAALADNSQGRMPPPWLPLLEGMVLCAVLVLTNVYVVIPMLEARLDSGPGEWFWLTITHPPSTVYKPNPTPVMYLSGGIGMLAGLLVPWFYRRWVAVSANERLIRHLEQFHIEIAEQISRVKQQDAMQKSLAFTCAYVAASDHRVDDVECDRFALILDEIANAKIKGFSRRQTEELFNAYARKIESLMAAGGPALDELAPEWRDLRVFIGRPELGRLVLRCCESLACSDKRIRRAEMAAIERIVDAMQLKKSEIVIRWRPLHPEGEMA